LPYWKEGDNPDTALTAVLREVKVGLKAGLKEREREREMA